jgi:hypothetical protein
MERVRAVRRTAPWLVGASCIVVAAIGGMLVSLWPAPTVGSLVLVSFAMSIPTHWLPGLAIAAFALIPFSYVSAPSAAFFFSPSTLLLVAYLGRRLMSGARLDGATLSRLLLLGVWLVITAVLGLNPARSLLFAAILLLVLTAAVIGDHRAAKSVLTSLTVTVLLLTPLAIYEVLTQASPLSEYFSDSPLDLTQKWGGYRIFTTIGHPLLNGTFFAIAAVALIAASLDRPSTVRVLAATAASFCLVATGARSSLLAFAVCLVVGIAMGKGVPGRRRTALALSVAIAAVAFSVSSVGSAIIARSETMEGSGSALQRVEVADLTLAAIGEANFLPAGLGNGNSLVARVTTIATQQVLESSLLQLLASISLAGLFLLVLVYVGHRSQGPMAARRMGDLTVLAYAISASGYNLFEAYPAALALMAIPFMLCRGDVASATDGNGPATDLRRWGAVAARASEGRQ